MAQNSFLFSFLLTFNALIWFVCGNCSLPIFTWNTLSVDDTFASGWGAMAEIVRLNNLVAIENISTAEAKAVLLSERYQRVSDFLNNARLHNKIMAIQEADLETVEGGEYLLKYFEPELDTWKIACVAKSESEQELLIIDTSYLKVKNTTVFNQDGVLGCSALVTVIETGTEVTVFTIHLSASSIRNPDTVSSTLSILLSLMPLNGMVVVGGDFNAHLPDLLEIVKVLDENVHEWSIFTATNNTFNTNQTHSFQYTVQHEHNYIAAYDGFLTRDYSTYSHSNIPSQPSPPLVILSPSSYMNDNNNNTMVKVYIEGFMPKYLGNEPYGQSNYEYSGGPYPNIDGVMLFQHEPYPLHTHKNDANQSLSDHLPITVWFNV